MGPQEWECGVLTTKLPGNSQGSFKLNLAPAVQGPGRDNNVPELIADPLSTSSALKKKWGSSKKFCSFLLPDSEPAKVRSFSFNTKVSLLLTQQSAKYFCVTYELRIVFTFLNSLGGKNQNNNNILWHMKNPILESIKFDQNTTTPIHLCSV